MKFDKLSLQLIFITPHCDLIYQLLWKRLPVGGRQRAWRPEHAACPLDGAQETIQHTITCREFLPAAFNTIDKCFLEADPQTHVGSATLIDLNPLVTPQGVLAWSAIVANWTVRNVVKIDAADVVPWAGFLTVWIAVVHLWARATNIAIAGSQLSIFAAALIALRDDGKLIHWTFLRQHLDHLSGGRKQIKSSQQYFLG